MTKTVRLTLCLFTLTSCVFGQTEKSPSSPPQSTKGPREKPFDGNWWLVAYKDERTGFLDGAGDCLTWAAHAKWLTRWTDNLDQEIDKYYRRHQSDRKALVLDVWRKILPTTPLPFPRPAGGEVYTNPHGYYNGLFWRQGSDLNNRGFVEGYLTCLRAIPSADTYSKSADYYRSKINDYTRARSRSDDEYIAVMLERFKDKAPSR